MPGPDERIVRTEDLTAYAEGRLPAGSGLRARVERHLREHPEDARRVCQYRRQDAVIHEAFDTVIEEPLPDHLLTGLSRPPRARWRPVAAIAAALVIGIGAGWTAARLVPESSGQPALYGFVERVGERIEQTPNVPVQSDDTVEAIASGNGPNLDTAGLELIGGGRAPDIEAGVFRFDYRDTAGSRIHLFVAPDIAPGSPTIHTRTVNGRLLAYWHLGDSTWVLGGEVGGDRLIELARRIRETVDDLPRRVRLDTPAPDRSGDMIAVNPEAARSALPGERGNANAFDAPAPQPLVPERM